MADLDVELPPELVVSNRIAWQRSVMDRVNSDPTCERVVLNGSTCNTIDPLGLGAILCLRKQIELTGRVFVLRVNNTGTVAKLVQVCRFEKILHMVRDVER